MQRTRAAFKLSLRYCRQQQQEIQADYLANSLSDKRFNKFWNGIRKCNNSKASAKINTINGCASDLAISEMWQRHFEALLDSVDDQGRKNSSCNVCYTKTVTALHMGLV